jgi:tRNA 2-selenouridine synthase
VQTITIEQALALRERGALLVDARSPAEYAEGTIPGAINIPILDDAERARVGTLYKEEGKIKAKRLGVGLVAPKIPELINQVDAALGGRKLPVLVFCWRGGMRSFTLATFFDLAGIPTMQIEGGHKAFRAVVRDFFAQGEWGRLLILRGLTGVGKTRLLKMLQKEGYPMVDLEGIANHRGSAFGNLGLAPQPSQTHFEALLWDEMRRIPKGGYALAEGESKHIGRLILPPRVYAALQVETSLWIEAPIETRVRITLDDYPARDELKSDFLRPLALIRPRLGGENHDRLLGYLEAGRWDDLARELMLLYYDPLYRHTCPEQRIIVTIADEEPDLGELKRAIARILKHPPGDPAGVEKIVKL